MKELTIGQKRVLRRGSPVHWNKGGILKALKRKGLIEVGMVISVSSREFFSLTEKGEKVKKRIM